MPVTSPNSPKCWIAAGTWLASVALTNAFPQVVLAASSPASATESGPASAAVLDARAAVKKDGDHWTLGAGAAWAPAFKGSDDYEIQPVPLVDVKYGRFFARTGDGIGFNVLETPVFTAGASVNWMQGYDEDDVPDGVEGADDALGARLFLSMRVKGAVATLEAVQAVTETDRGMTVGAGLAYPVQATDRLTLTPSLGVTWASEKFMDGYFGIDGAEAAASGLRAYAPGSGLRDVTLRLSAHYRFTDNLSAVGSIGLSHLLDEAADSPLVEERTQPLGLIGLTYTF